MGELTVREENTPDVPAAPPAPPGPVSALAAWAYDASQAHKIATSLAKTSFVPASLRSKPDDITAAILTGQELGLQPMASLRAMDVIQGTPALRAHAMRGLVLSRGHDVELVESDDIHCIMRGRRRGAEAWQVVTWTIERAQRLGLTGKDQWKKQPTTMLIARATGEICRLIAADVLYAAPYVAEELDDSNGGPMPVTRAEILAQEAEDEAEAAEGPPPRLLEHGEADEIDDPWASADADAAGQASDENNGWPEVRKPGSGA